MTKLVAVKSGAMKKTKYLLVASAICGLCILISTVVFPPSAHIFSFQSLNLSLGYSHAENKDMGFREAYEIPTPMANTTVETKTMALTLPRKVTYNKTGDTTTDVKLPRKLTCMVSSVKKDVKPSATKKLIVMFNRPDWLLPGDPHYQKVFDTCPYTCTITDDRKQLPRADAMWVDLSRLKEPHPPSHRPPGQIWVAHASESPLHYYGNHDARAWRNVFNRTFSYRTDSDFFLPYGMFEFHAKPAVENYTKIMLNKTRPIAWFVSNCRSESKRERYAARLKRYIDIDIYGYCGKFRCEGMFKEDCLSPLNTTYFFYLSFENSYCQDYMTEKLFKTYKNLNIIPIVRGGFNYSQYLPPNTYLDTANFSSPKHLAQYLRGLMKDVHTYTGMLRTKKHFYAPESSWLVSNTRPFCQLCKMLQMSPPPSKVYPDIMEWSSKDKCWTPQDV